MACEKPEYAHLITNSVKAAVSEHGGKADRETLVSEVMDNLAVNFGEQILKIVPGYVSTEVDARLSYDKQATVQKARKIIKMYAKKGIKKERILIKIASTWEGIQAAKQLQKEGILCNLTLLFSFCQAQACAEAGVTLISPFVGRILDWFKKATGKEYKPHEEPGVHSVSKIYNYYKKCGYKTYVMGASFRNSGEIMELAGCDRLTISPKLLTELENSTAKVQHKLCVSKAKKTGFTKQSLSEKQFRWEMNEDPMATEKLTEGIRKFAADTVTLEEKVKGFLKSSSSKKTVSKKATPVKKTPSKKSAARPTTPSKKRGRSGLFDVAPMRLSKRLSRQKRN